MTMVLHMDGRRDNQDREVALEVVPYQLVIINSRNIGSNK